MKNRLLKTLLIFTLALFGTNCARADFSFNDMELNFVQVSDVHLSDAPDTSYKVLSNSKDLLDSAIKDINSMKGIDFVVFTGDMVNEPTKEYYKDFLTSVAKLKQPVLFTLGNHDVSGNSDNTSYLDKSTVVDIIDRSNPYQKYGKPYFAYSPNADYRVIVLDTTEGYEGRSNGYLPNEQLIFLDNEISNNADKVIVIFQHHPVIEPFKSADHKLLNADEYMAVLKKYPKVPIAVFAGHYHAAKIITKGHILYSTSPALVTYPNAYRTVKITNYDDRVVFNFSFNETRLKNVQSKSKAGLIATAVFSGMPSDRNTEVVIRKGYAAQQAYTKEEIKEAKKALKEKKAQIKAEYKAEKEAQKAMNKANKNKSKSKKGEAEVDIQN